jgi:hypothetical protein
MKLAAFGLIFALTLGAQTTTEDVVSRLDSTLQAINADKDHGPISMVIAEQKAMAHLKISTAMQSSTSNVFDAIAQAISDLEARPANRRRIIVVIGESDQSRRTLECAHLFCRALTG